MKEFDFVIVGAGASGLMAAYQLAGNNKTIALLEGRDRVGGRTQTTTETGFSYRVETGAEFVHGKLPLSLSLLKKSRLDYYNLEGRSYTVHGGILKNEEEAEPFWPELMQRLNSLENDMTLAEFLDNFFAGDAYKNLRESVTRLAQGFDAADPKRVSAFSLRKEWKQDDEEHQYRIQNGYSALFTWLAGKCQQKGVTLFLSHGVNRIDHSGSRTMVSCSNGETFVCSKVLVTVSLGIWMAHPGSETAIEYFPSLPGKQRAATQMGYGNVVKTTVEFTDFFWENNQELSMPGAGFIFSDAPFPTWWTQNPVNVPQLSGWLAGPPSEKLKTLNEDQVKEIVLASLAEIFGTAEEIISKKIKALVVSDWSKDPWALGGYSYDTVESATAKKIMMEPVNDKLYFAGEALYEGAHNGTVEAALVSGERAAKEISK